MADSGCLSQAKKSACQCLDHATQCQLLIEILDRCAFYLRDGKNHQVVVSALKPVIDDVVNEVETRLAKAFSSQRMTIGSVHNEQLKDQFENIRRVIVKLL
ncbi:hypothetical protein ACOME3_008317 [Neoechinorhynchus agilis]